ncbi:hypothetical protein [Halostagnicola kamekurae]|uniref:Uncharacterized protein n=1 Tax=Halostagnicola kamekurae TaxID=619731 RepID=A0A1I6V7C5_9EURY|nr:hypothetical protein [Halostagnicola kamekurae]SFT09547.1 hypothetical protein SAMN04488556_0097 [Halostagnicola kamekurae]
MENLNPDSGAEWVNYVVFLVIGMTLLVFGGAFYELLGDMLMGDLQAADHLASILSAFATIVLVAVTGWYVSLTSNLVSQTEKQRQQERELEISRHETRKQNLRQAFLIELNEISSTLREIAKSGEDNQVTPNKYLDVLMPTIVYESNADQIGILTADEATSLTNIYTQLLHLRGLLESYSEIKEKDDLTRDEKAKKELTESLGSPMAAIILNEIEEVEDLMVEEVEEARTIDQLPEAL